MLITARHGRTSKKCQRTVNFCALVPAEKRSVPELEVEKRKEQAAVILFALNVFLEKAIYYLPFEEAMT